MKKILLTQAICLLSYLFISTVSGQAIDYKAQAYQYIKEEFSLDQKAIGDLVIKDIVPSVNNDVHHVHFVQYYHGYEIFGTEINLAFLKNGKITSVGHRLTIIDGLPFSSKKAEFEAPQAIGIIAGSLGIATRSVPVLVNHTPAGVPVYSKSDIGLQDIPAELGYMHATSGEYHLAWKIQLESAKDGQLYLSFVDATDGSVIANDELTSHCSFEQNYLSRE